jgi:hypothetical protein
MREHPLAPIIRRWLCLFGILALCFVWKELALGLFPMLFMPPAVLAAPDCPVSGTNHACSSTRPATLTVVISSIPNVACFSAGSCNNFNGTFVCSTQSDSAACGTGCNWSYPLTFGNCNDGLNSYSAVRVFFSIRRDTYQGLCLT